MLRVITQLGGITGFAFSGIDVLPIEVQVAISGGLPTFAVVGLPDKAVGESRERVRAALSAIGLALPAKRITVNLAPADVQKEGSHFDLPIALGVLVAMGVIDPVKVVRTALQNAASVAGLLITTECAIVDKPKDEKGGGGHDHDHGMDDY